MKWSVMMCPEVFDEDAFVNEMAGGSRLARVDVTDDDDVNVELLFSHFFWFLVNLVKLRQ